MASKKRILVLGGLVSDTKPHTPYAEEFSRLMPEHSFTEVRFDQLVFLLRREQFSITDGRTGEELSNYDLVIFRGRIRKSSALAYVVSRYCQLTNTASFNDYTNYRPSSKLAQTVLFYEQQVPFIDTIFSLDKNLLQAAIAKQFGFPSIIKDNYGAHGYHNHLVKNETEAAAVLAENPDIQFLAQQFCDNDGDYRVLVIGDQEPLQIWRQAVGDSHLNNTSQGGTSKLVRELPPDMVRATQSVAAQLKMSVAGVDLLKSSDDGQLYFLEVNSQPQLLTGAFTDKKAQRIKEYIMSQLAGTGGSPK